MALHFSIKNWSMKENFFFYEKPFFLGFQQAILRFCSFYTTQVIDIFVKVVSIWEEFFTKTAISWKFMFYIIAHNSKDILDTPKIFWIMKPWNHTYIKVIYNIVFTKMYISPYGGRRICLIFLLASMNFSSAKVITSIF